MIAIAGLLIGAALGWRSAGARGGNRLDQAQYAAVWGIIGGVLGLAGTIALERML